MRDDTQRHTHPHRVTDTGTHTKTCKTTEDTEADSHIHGCRGIGPRFTDPHIRGPESRRDTEIMYVHGDTGAHICKSLRGGSIDTRRHTQIPTDTHAGTGVGLEALTLHKAGPLRGAPRHRGPLLTKPPAGSKSDPPSRLQRGQRTRLPCPPPPPRSALLLRSRSGGGRPAAARGGQPPDPRQAAPP